MAGASASAQSVRPAWRRTASARRRQPAASRGAAGYHAPSAPSSAARANGEPPSGSVRTTRSLTVGDSTGKGGGRTSSLVIRFAAKEGAGAVQLLGEHQTGKLVRERPRRQGDERPGARAERGVHAEG